MIIIPLVLELEIRKSYFPCQHIFLRCHGRREGAVFYFLIIELFNGHGGDTGIACTKHRLLNHVLCYNEGTEGLKVKQKDRVIMHIMAIQ